MLYTILASISCWTIGDLGAQWYEYRNRKRGCILASNQRENNSTIRKSREVDILRLTHASLFGLFSAPLLLGYQKVVIPRIFGRLQRAATPSLLALGVHQLVLTPTVLLAYFNCMTALRGGFHDTSFMHAHEEIGASRRYTVSSIQRYMMEDVLPLPLLSSWIAVAPIFFSAIAYMDSKWINSDERRGSEKENISTAPPLSEDSLPLFLKQKLEKIRNRSSASSHSVSSYEGFGSFHSENVEVLIGQSNEIYTPPVIPLVARRVLKKDKVDALNAYTSKDEEMLEAEMGRLVERPTKKCEFGETFRKEYFIITQDMVFINHGGFGSALYGAMFMKHQLEKRMEHEVVEFVDREVLPLVVYSVRRVSDFIHSNPWDVVLVQNATFAMNSAIKLIESSDVVAYFDTEYLAVYKIMWYHCKKVGAPFFELPLNQFIHDEEIMGNDEKLAAHICSLLPEGCTTLIMDHVTSTSALCFPVFSHIIPAVRKCGVKKIIVDGAHAPLQVDLNFNDLPELSKPTVYLGNFHKWMSSPKGAGFLWADRKAVPSGFSAVLSHGAGDGFLSEFIWDGTKDYGAYLTLPAIIDFWTTQNLSRVREYCSTLLQDAVKMLTNAFESRRVARHSPFMALVELPNKLQERRASAKYIQDMLHDEFSIEVPIKHIEGRFYVRISAFVYNTLAEYVYLKEAVLIIADWCDSSSRAIEMK